MLWQIGQPIIPCSRVQIQPLLAMEENSKNALANWPAVVVHLVKPPTSNTMFKRSNAATADTRKKYEKFLANWQ